MNPPFDHLRWKEIRPDTRKPGGFARFVLVGKTRRASMLIEGPPKQWNFAMLSRPSYGSPWRLEKWAFRHGESWDLMPPLPAELNADQAKQRAFNLLLLEGTLSYAERNTP